MQTTCVRRVPLGLQLTIVITTCIGYFIILFLFNLIIVYYLLYHF